METKMPRSRRSEIVVQQLDNEVLIYDLRTHKSFCLNRTAAFVWNACDGRTEIAEVSRRLAKSSRQFVTQEVIWLAIEELKSFDLLETAAPAASDETDARFAEFKTLSRREAIKRAGMASTVVLPVIAALTAPRAVDAASGSTCNTACASSATCAAPCPNCTGIGTCGNTFTICSQIAQSCTSTGTCNLIAGFPLGSCSNSPGTSCTSNANCTVIATCTALNNTTPTCQA